MSEDEGKRKLSSSLSKSVVLHPWAALLGVALATLLALSSIVNPLTGEVYLQLDPAIGKLLSQRDAGGNYYEEVRTRFGNDDVMLIAVEHPKLFSYEGLTAVKQITERLEAVDEVDRVLSLAAALRIRGSGDDLEIAPFLDEIPEDAVKLSSLRDEVLSSPLYSGNLISRDGLTACFVIYFGDVPEEVFIEDRLDLHLRDLALEVAPDAAVWTAGGPHVKAETSAILLTDLAVSLPIILGLMLVFAGLATRTVAGTLVPTATVLIAMIWTLGIVAATGHALNIITTLVPPLVLIVGFAYVIHVVMALCAEARRAGDAAVGSRELMGRALHDTAFPVMLTALTTMIGFLSLGVSSLEVVRDFGLYSAVGMVAACLASLTFAPSVLSLAHPPRPGGLSGFEQRVDEVVSRLGRWDIRHRNAILAGGMLIALVSAVGVPRVIINTETIRNFRPDAAVRRSHEAIDERLEGTNRFYVVVEASAPNGLKDPAVLREIESLQEFLDQQPEIGGTTSLADFVRVFHRAFRGGSREFDHIPDSKRLIAQLLLVSPREQLEEYSDYVYQTGIVHVRTTATSSRELSDLVGRVEERLAALPESLKGGVTGASLLVTQTVDRISEGQVRSLVAAFALIFTILAVYLRSLRLGLIALVPNVIPILVYFGFLGWAGVSLNNATALMGSMVIGIAVDDTIHFLVNFRRAARGLDDDALAVIAALDTVGRPVTCTTLVICLGLLTIANSDLDTQAIFGVLGALTLVVAWLVDIVFTPALFSRFAGMGGGRSDGAPSAP